MDGRFHRSGPVFVVGIVLALLPHPALSQEPKPGTPVPVRIPPAEPPISPLRPAIRQSDVRQAPELAIIEVRRVGRERIHVGELVPVDVVVKNSGNREVTVRPQSRDVSQGTARFTNGSEALVEPGEVVTLRLDLVASGSGFSVSGRGGGALCSERSERTIVLFEAPAAVGPPGYRPGNAERPAWAPFRDGNNLDNERVVSFRFDCDVTFQN